MKGVVAMKTKVSALLMFPAILGLSLLTGAAALAQEIPAGPNGKLTAKDLMSAPMPHWAPTFPTADHVGHYDNFDMVIVSYATDEDKAAAMIPKDLQLVKIPALPGQAPVTLTFAKYREVDTIGPYMEAIVSIPVLYKGALYLYVPAIYVDTDAALLAGRELGGYPKKLANITMRNYGDLYVNEISRPTMQKKTSDPMLSDLASSSVKKGGRLVSIPLPADKINPLPFPYNMLVPLPKATGKPQNYVLSTMGLRYFPGVGKGPNGVLGADVLQLISTPWVVTKGEIYKGLDTSMELFASKEDPIAKVLPFNAVLGSYIVRGDMYTDAREWVLIKDYLKK
jgi:hypothetical protein